MTSRPHPLSLGLEPADPKEKAPRKTRPIRTAKTICVVQRVFILPFRCECSLYNQTEV